MTDELDVEQGKLSLGFRTGIAPTDERYYALALYNSILGSGAHSKLFNNVREKLSLAYYVFSRLERFKGAMIISSGIEIPSFQAAYDEIMAQMEALGRGEITGAEFTAAKNSMKNMIQSLADAPRLLQDYYLGQLMAGTDDDLTDFVQKIEAVTPEQVVEVSKNIRLDTVYFLKNRGVASHE